MKWNGLTYTGHTVWNVHNEITKGSGYRGGNKRQPRTEWVITENTHKALITTDEAEAILAQLEKSSHSKGRRTAANYLLTGILKTPQGNPWFGDGRNSYSPKRTDAGQNRKVVTTGCKLTQAPIEN